MSILLAGGGGTLYLGPFLDDTDQKTAETGLTLTVYLSKNSGASVARNSAGAITHDRSGYYRVPVNDTDTDTPGVLTVFASPAGALPVRQDYIVMHVNGWTLYTLGMTTVDVTKIGGDATAAANLKTAFTGGNYTAAGLSVKQATSITNTVNANMVNMDSNATAFANLVALAKGVVLGLVGAGTNTTTVVTTLLASATSGFYKDKTFIALTGANAGQGGKLVTAYDGATKRLTIEALTAAMAPGDTFALVG